MNTNKLTELRNIPRNTKIDVSHLGLKVKTLLFHYIDDAYSYCTDDDRNPHQLLADTMVRIYVPTLKWYRSKLDEVCFNKRTVSYKMLAAWDGNKCKIRPFYHRGSGQNRRIVDESTAIKKILLLMKLEFQTGNDLSSRDVTANYIKITTQINK